MTDLADAYAEIQSRMVDTALALDEVQRSARVPACPDPEPYLAVIPEYGPTNGR